MKSTPLREKHIALGAKLVDFAGFEMPVQYTSIKEEHATVRNGVGMFDVSHMGEFIVKGKEALDLIQLISSNDASKLEIGQAQYACIPNKVGGVVDDFLVYRLPEDKCADGERAYMLVVNAGNIQKDWDWISSHNSFDCNMVNISDQTSLLAVQGPKATEVIQKLTSYDLSTIPYYHFVKAELSGFKNVIVSATGYTGAGGYELYMNNSQVEKVWDDIMAAGIDQGIKAIGLGARDTLRLEMGFCLYGNDIDDTTSPIEAGLSWITKVKKPTPFNSQEIFATQKKEGVSKKLVGFKVTDRRVPRHDYKILDVDNNEIGKVTSGTLSPTLGTPIGLGYVSVDHSKIGTKILIDTGRKTLDAEIVKPPFIK